jgi:S1-C subfamily serine protease
MHRHGIRAVFRACSVVWAMTGTLSPPAFAQAAPASGSPSAIEVQARALRRASDAVVGVETRAVEDARSLATLGRQRQGSGVVIGGDGLVLTIGYLVLEAEQVELVTDDGRRIPARVVAYDQATGFGLVQGLLPLGLEPVPLGDPARVPKEEPLVVASGGDDGTVSSAQLTSRRAFSGYWEYHVEGALFTSPPRRDHPGAALFNSRGELLGIGSLLVNDAAGPDAPRAPGNMFVPVDLLKPILAELRAQGRSRASLRPWMGINCAETGSGGLRVLRVTDDSPADVAGLQAGDRIVGIDGTPVNSLAGLWKTLWATAPAERAVRLDILRDDEPMAVIVNAVDRAKTLRRAEGI